MANSTPIRISRRAGLAALLLAALPGTLLAGAAPDLTGDWQGKLQMDASNALTVRFTFTKAANGTYTAVLNSPDNPAVKDTTVSGVTWDGTNLKLAVPSLSGAYAGALKAGKIGGQWTQPGAALPLELSPYQKPVMTADVVRPFVGAWTGKLELAAQKQTLVLQFKQGAGGALEGTFGIPDQGMTQPMTDVRLENGELAFRAIQGRIDFKGKIAAGKLVGKLKVPSPAAPPDGIDMSFDRGDYKPAPVALALSAEAIAKLKGKWNGVVSATNPQNGQKIDIPVVVRFETNAKGEHNGFLDSPNQGVNGMIMTFAALEGDKFTARIATAQVEYVGTVTGNKIGGEWAQGGQRLPLELTKAP